MRVTQLRISRRIFYTKIRKRVVQFDARCFVFIKRSLPFPPNVRSLDYVSNVEKSRNLSSSILSTRIVIQGVIKFQTCLENSLSFFLFLFDKCLLQIEIDRRNAWKDAINYQRYSTFVNAREHALELNYKWQFRYSN